MGVASIARVAIDVPLYRCFDYQLPDACHAAPQLGVRMKVPFGKGQKIGILVELSDQSELPLAKLKVVEDILDSEPLISHDLLSLCRWAAAYYHAPLGEVLAASLPQLLRQGRAALVEPARVWQLRNAADEGVSAKRAPKQANILEQLRAVRKGLSTQSLVANGATSQAIKSLEKKGVIESVEFYPKEVFLSGKSHAMQLTEHQASALSDIKKSLGTFKPILLEGVTGSGKTEVYLQLVAEVLSRGQQALILVPEISLTPQTIARFKKRFTVPVVALHSGMTAKARLEHWLQAKSGEAKIIIGTRSAIFTPCSELGLIVVDEEHDASLKQQEGFRYSARDLALVRGHRGAFPVVLGSATPSLESLNNLEEKGYLHLRLPQRAGSAKLPEYRLIDMRQAPGKAILSSPLVEAIEKRLSANQQILLFLNRRGFAPVLLCRACGWTATCRRCDAKLTLHHHSQKLVCHHCEGLYPLPKDCESCGQTKLAPLGQGTERIEYWLNEHFPNTKIQRIDRDSMSKKGALETSLKDIATGEPQILIGTQMLAKGHHFPNVTLVGILDVDYGLLSTDFKAMERVGQLIVQVAGRAGRGEKPGQVFIQSHRPDHPLLQVLVKEGYATFAKQLLQERREAGLPPFSYSVLLRAAAPQLATSMAFLHSLKRHLSQTGQKLTLWGPSPASMTKRAGLYRAQMLILSPSRVLLHRSLDEVIEQIPSFPEQRKVRWSVDVDPVDFL